MQVRGITSMSGEEPKTGPSPLTGTFCEDFRSTPRNIPQSSEMAHVTGVQKRLKIALVQDLLTR